MVKYGHYFREVFRVISDRPFKRSYQCANETKIKCWPSYGKIHTIFLGITIIAQFSGQTFKAHRLVLAACSTHFESLFNHTPVNAPLNNQFFVILDGTRADDLQILLHFMYRGEAYLHQDRINSVLRTAEVLQVKGLSEGPRNVELNTQNLHGPSPSSSSAAAGGGGGGAADRGGSGDRGGGGGGGDRVERGGSGGGTASSRSWSPALSNPEASPRHKKKETLDPRDGSPLLRRPVSPPLHLSGGGGSGRMSPTYPPYPPHPPPPARETFPIFPGSIRGLSNYHRSSSHDPPHAPPGGRIRRALNSRRHPHTVRKKRYNWNW